MAFKVLTDGQAAHFVEKGYVKIEGCFEKAEIQDWLDLAYLRLGYDRDDPSTWVEDRIHNMLHSAAPNPSGRPRIITNPPVAFVEPMNFNRENPDEFSLVEKTVLRALGVERLDYRITGEREGYYTEFRRERERMLVEQKARLAELEKEVV